MKFKPKILPVSKLLLDPNNQRFLDSSDWTRRQERRFHDAAVQEATLRLLERAPRYQLADLRRSILTNGYIPMERIIVVPYTHDQGRYLVVEGNRRVAVLKALLRDHAEGVLTLTDDQIKNFSKVSSAILEAAPGREFVQAERVIMGIRHITGPRAWGAYQQAHFIFELVEDEGQDFATIADHLGLTKVETARRYRAMRALEGMMNDDMYSGAASPQFYRLFHELVASPQVREFFAWNHDDASFSDEEKARQFFELIAPQTPDVQPKLRTYIDVRQLRTVVGIPEAEAALFDPDETLAGVFQKARKRKEMEPTADAMDEVRRFKELLEGVSIDVLRNLTEEDVGELEALISLISTRIDDYKALSRSSV